MEDETVSGHTISTLRDFESEDIVRIMEKHKDNKAKWIRKIATEYLEKREQKW